MPIARRRVVRRVGGRAPARRRTGVRRGGSIGSFFRKIFNGLKSTKIISRMAGAVGSAMGHPLLGASIGRAAGAVGLGRRRPRRRVAPLARRRLAPIKRKVYTTRVGGRRRAPARRAPARRRR